MEANIIESQLLPERCKYTTNKGNHCHSFAIEGGYGYCRACIQKPRVLKELECVHGVDVRATVSRALAIKNQDRYLA